MKPGTKCECNEREHALAVAAAAGVEWIEGIDGLRCKQDAVRTVNDVHLCGPCATWHEANHALHNAGSVSQSLHQTTVALRKIRTDINDILDWGAATSSDRALHARMLTEARDALDAIIAGSEVPR
jgi:hypothetical protein